MANIVQIQALAQRISPPPSADEFLNAPDVNDLSDPLARDIQVADEVVSSPSSDDDFDDADADDAAFTMTRTVFPQNRLI